MKDPHVSVVLSLNEMAEIILSRRTCKSIMDYRFDTLLNVLKTKVNAFKVQFRNSAEILKLLDSNFVFHMNYLKMFRLQREQHVKSESEVIDHRLDEIAHEIELLKTVNGFDIDRVKQKVSLINQYIKQCRIIFDNKTLVFYQYERKTEPGFFGGIFLLNTYLDDAELELFSVMSLTGKKPIRQEAIDRELYQKVYEVNKINLKGNFLMFLWP